MKRKSLILLTLGLLGAFAFFARPASAEEAYTLDNGLKVILFRQPGSGTVSGRLAFNVGSSDEADPSEYGMAHLLEHLLVKSESRAGDGPVKYLVEDNGGNINAFTSKDVTAYVIDLPAEAADRLPGYLVDQAANPLFLPEQVAEEQEIVTEEINQSNDNPNSKFTDAAFAQFWGEHHPFTHPILGTAESVRGATPDSIRKFHSRFYRPDNAVLIIAGDFDTETMKRMVKEQAGSWPRPAEPKPMRTTVEPQTHAIPAVQIVESPNVSVARALLTFPGYKGASTKSAASDLLTTVLSGGLSSRLDDKVKRQEELVTAISAYSATYADYGYTVIWLETSPDKLVSAVEASLKVVEDLFDNPPDATELERARSLGKKSLLGAQDSTSGIADAILDFATHGGGWRMRELYPAALDATNAQDVLDIGRDVFARQKAAISVLMPPAEEAAKEEYVSELTALADGFALPAAVESADAAPAFVELEPIDGIRILAMRDPSRQMVRIEAAVKGGVVAETEQDNGLYSLMANSWAKATKKRPAGVLIKDIEQLGATIAGDSSTYTTRLSGDFIKDNWREALALYTEVLTEPAFNSGDVEEARREQLAGISRRDERLAARAIQLADKTFFAGHPYGMETLGNREQVEKYTAEQVAGLYKDAVENGEMIIAVAGDIDPREARDILRSGLSGWRAGSGSHFVLPPAPVVAEGPRVEKEEIQSAQTHLIITFPAPPADSPDRAAMQLVSSHLGGLSGPMFRELREDLRLAYSTFPLYSPYVDAGDMKWYISCEPSKVQTALDGMLGILKRLRENGLTSEEVEAAKRSYIGEYRIYNQSLGRITLQTLVDVLYDRGADFRDRYLETVKAVTAEDVNRVIERYLSLDDAVITVLGSNVDIELKDAAE